MSHDPLLIADAAAWRAWLDANEASSDGIWLLLAKKGTTEPTSLSYAQALEEALCSGWIDGQKRSHDAAMFLQRFTPRRKRSLWSQRNVGIVAALIEQGRMRPRGHSEIELARGDGRWDRAYTGSATAVPPADFLAVLADHPAAAKHFESLTKSGKYQVFAPLLTVSDARRAQRISKIVDGLGK